MRICIATDSYYYPQLGGITEHVHGQARSLRARGHDVTILTDRLLHAPPTSDRADRILADDDLEIVRMGVALPLYGNGSQTLQR
jgi:glycosyltransferase involved in cell wall biosynthesis